MLLKRSTFVNNVRVHFVKDGLSFFYDAPLYLWEADRYGFPKRKLEKLQVTNEEDALLRSERSFLLSSALMNKYNDIEHLVVYVDDAEHTLGRVGYKVSKYVKQAYINGGEVDNSTDVEVLPNMRYKDSMLYIDNQYMLAGNEAIQFLGRVLQYGDKTTGYTHINLHGLFVFNTDSIRIEMERGISFGDMIVYIDYIIKHEGIVIENKLSDTKFEQTYIPRIVRVFRSLIGTVQRASMQI